MQLDERMERALLGAILLDNKHFHEAIRTLSSEDFALDSNRKIFRRMGEMIAARKGVDALTLSAELDKHGELSTVGGMFYLVSLDEGLPRTRAVDGYVRSVGDASRLRRAREIGAGIVAKSENEGANADAIIAAAKLQIAEIEFRHPRSTGAGMFQDAVEFAAESPATVDWLIEGIIPRAGNGIIGGHPKASKSFTALDIAMSASCGAPWMGMSIPKRIKTAIVSREDEPGLTQRRIKKLIAGRGEYSQLPNQMLINTRRHQADFKLTRDEHMDALIDQLGRFGAELVILDVFRSLHDGEENDNTEVAKVLARVSRIQSELNCATALVHHIAKADGGGNIFRGLRGASAIHGWMEWGIGISVTNPEEEDRANYIRRAEFESKESTAHAVYFKIAESADHATVRLENASRPTQRRQGTTNSILPPSERRAERARADLQ